MDIRNSLDLFIRAVDQISLDGELLAALVKSVSVAVFYARPPYAMTFCSPGFLSLMGWSDAVAVYEGKSLSLLGFLPDEERSLSSLVGFETVSAQIPMAPFKRRDETIVICHVCARKISGNRIFLSLTDVGGVLEDGLTGLHNRYYFEAMGAGMIDLSRRRKGHVNLFLIDVDDLKSINKKFTHSGGDEALKFTAAAVKKVFGRRAADLVARFGGDEFAALLISGGKTGINASQLMGRLKEEMQAGCPALGGERISATVGVASFKFYAQSLFMPPLAALVYEASQALLRIKEGGDTWPLPM